MNFAITLFVLGVLTQVSLNAAAPMPYGARPVETKAVPTDPAKTKAVSADPAKTEAVSTDSAAITDKNECGCESCSCTSGSDNCGCVPPPEEKVSHCGCVGTCNCIAHKPDKKCGCEKPCSCGIKNPSFLSLYEALRNLTRRRSQ